MENEIKKKKTFPLAVVISVWIVLILVIIAIAIYIVMPTPKKTAIAAMNCLAKGESYKFSQYTANDVSYFDFVGIHIISFKVLSASSGMVKHEVNLVKYDVIDTDESFKSTKEFYSRQYPDYVVIVNTADEYVLQSPTKNIEQTILYMDVEYSDIMGNIKRVGAYVTVEPETPGKHDYIVTDITGIY